MPEWLIETECDRQSQDTAPAPLIVTKRCQAEMPRKHLGIASQQIIPSADNHFPNPSGNISSMKTKGEVGAMVTWLKVCL